MMGSIINTKKVYLKDNGEAIQVIDLDSNKMIYQFSYMSKNNLIWNRDDAWRKLRKQHLTSDLYREVFKCKCGNVLEIPIKFEAERDSVNRIKFILNCKCNNKIIVTCDTLRI